MPPNSAYPQNATFSSVPSHASTAESNGDMSTGLPARKFPIPSYGSRTTQEAVRKPQEYRPGSSSSETSEQLQNRKKIGMTPKCPRKTWKLSREEVSRDQVGQNVFRTKQCVGREEGRSRTRVQDTMRIHRIPRRHQSNLVGK